MEEEVDGAISGKSASLAFNYRKEGQQYSERGNG
jgi:hypothetical protein